MQNNADDTDDRQMSGIEGVEKPSGNFDAGMGGQIDGDDGQHPEDGPVDCVSCDHQGFGILRISVPQSREPRQNVEHGPQGGPSAPAEHRVLGKRIPVHMVDQIGQPSSFCLRASCQESWRDCRKSPSVRAR